MLVYYDLLYIKEKHIDFDLLYVMVEDQEFIFRSLTREEYREIISIITTDLEFEDAVCQCTLVYPNEYDFAESYLPGLSTNITSQIVQMSHINNVDGILSVYEVEKNNLINFDEQCFILIKTAFPEFDYNDIRKWSWKKIMQFVARAEIILKMQGKDIGLINNTEEVSNEMNEKIKDITDKEIGDALRKQSVDPMEYFSHEFNTYNDKIDYPIIGTLNWRDDDLMYSIGKQMEKKYEKRKSKKSIQFVSINELL